MVTLDRIRLTGLLREDPANAGSSYVCDRCRADDVAEPRPLTYSHIGI